MSDFISRQDTIEELEHIMCDHPLRGYEDEQLLINAVKSLPSAQPEIIRCKDCKYQDENWRRISVKWLPCMDVRTGSNWFCGSAERRTDE